MSLNPLKKGLFALVVLTTPGAGCQTNTDISSASGEKGNRPNSSTGLGDLKPDAGSAPHMDPPNNIQPWPDASVYPDTAPTGKDEKCAAESQAAKQVPVDLLLLVDRSGSMTYKTPGGKSKWELAQDALVAFVKDGKSAGMGVGLQYFPLLKTCQSDAECTASIFGNGSCMEAKGCATAAGVVMNPTLSCANRPTICPTGTTCVSLGRCAETGTICTNLNGNCMGGTAANRCTATPRTCRDGLTAMCQVADYERLAVPIADLPMAAPGLTLSLMSTTPSGGTPTDPAVEAALGQLRMRAMTNPGRHEALVLVTDGQPNSCNAMPIPLITRLIGEAKMGMPSIPTYAIGVFTPDEVMDGQMTLQEWSTAGGTGMPFILTAGDDLTQKLLDALNAIRGSALPCEYMIPMPAMGSLDYGKVNVHVTGSGVGPMGQDLGYVTDASKCDPVKGGWHYDVNPTTGTPTRVIMCEATCKKFKMDSTANIELRFGCQTVVIQ